MKNNTICGKLRKMANFAAANLPLRPQKTTMTGIQAPQARSQKTVLVYALGVGTRIKDGADRNISPLMQKKKTQKTTTTS